MCEYALQHVQLLSCINACSVECIGISSVLTCITVCVCVCVMRYHGNHLPSECLLKDHCDCYYREKKKSGHEEEDVLVSQYWR